MRISDWSSDVCSSDLKWLLASFLLSASEKGMSSHQLHRTLGVTYKTAWFMTHRIRDAMRDDGTSPLGGSGKTVERSEEHTSELQSLMRISYAVFCLKKKNK